MRKNYSLTEGVIWKSLLFFAIPIMLSQLLQQLYNAVDSAIVGTYAGSMPLAAVGSSAALINLLVGFFLGLASGASVIFANYYGAENKNKMIKTINTSLLISVICGIVITVLGMVWTRPLLEFMNCPEDVMELSVTYLRIYFIGVIGMMIYNVGAGLITARGDSKHPLYYLVFSGILNLILDVIFVAILNMGVAGAALATVIAQYFSAFLVIYNLANIDEEYKLRINKISFDNEIFKEIVKVSVPCGLQSAMFNISNMLVQMKINGFGSIIMAGGASYLKIDSFLYVPMVAFGLAISTYVAQNIGAGKRERVNKGVKISLALATVMTITMSTTVLLTGKYLIGLFTKDEEVKNIGIMMMNILAPFTFTHSFTEVLAGKIRGEGKALQAMILTATGICGFRILWLIAVLPIFNSISALYWCYPSSWIFCSICFALYNFKEHLLKN